MQNLKLRLKASASGSPIEIIKTGEFHLGSRGTIEVTEEHLDEMCANFPGPDILPIDWNHGSLETDPEAGSAAGWIQSLFKEGSASHYSLMGTIRWTDRAREAIENEEWKYISAELSWNDIDTESGEAIGCTLHAAALTNRPAVPGMAPVTLSQDDKVKKEFSIQYDYPVEVVKDGSVYTRKDGKIYKVGYQTGPGDSDVFFAEERLWTPVKSHWKERNMAKRGPKPKPNPGESDVDRFWSFVRQEQMANPKLSGAEARKAVLAKNKEFKRMFPDPKPVKDGNPYLDTFMKLAEEVRREKQLKPFESRAEIKLKYPELFRAAFNRDPESRFCAGVEVEMGRGLPMDKAYKLVAANLPSEAVHMSLKDLR